MPDIVKWIVAIAVLAAALVGFYVFSEQSQLLRVVALLVALGVALAILYQTAKGREAWSFIREARTEVRKVVWPTRKETVQTTGIVIVMVSILAVILWILDAVLTNAVRAVLGVGS